MPVKAPSSMHRLSRRALIGVAAAALGAVALKLSPLAAAEEARAVPVPVMDEPAAPGETQKVAVLAGGCFWGVQGVFQHVEGVNSAVSGYAGGERATAEYEKVGTGRTGHAEAVRIVYDPRKVSYAKLLQIYFSVVHDPTQLNRQGPDTGTQYRSAIFPADAEQARIAKAYIAQLNQARAFDAAIVTKIEPERTFYPAEAYHQDFLTRHPSHPYIVIHDLPKVESLKRFFPEIYRAKPVLVSQMAN
ncbi:peptide-methionine (S)-S-oxide reductase MsrA [Bosea sp. F3-2]|uniref:peptide-methionine (S)-S-oxide reductase MsrA n=1 Tax=Bosea sp. F3-2 TaxID=2599640 RepID=UPI0011F04151|nr:peptide-methionine (S)-S-oxide reductase MsrA [Bosea sp. F3-2]QEL24642.1 peptide-methionine (S)-S-oxide reductase MsrA [Bosea sp. F3-2]